MLVLGIETSCDETAAAVVSDSGDVYSDVVRSQIASHAPYGGVVPEIASRDHARAVVPVVREAIAASGFTLAQIDGIAVTSRPGLSGALLVGLSAAKGLAWATQKPFVTVDHLVGHLLAVLLQRPGSSAPRPEYPFIALLVSGGHTAIYRVNGPELSLVHEIGATRDDAAGEAFDKVAKLLGLGYPGGPQIDRLAAIGNAARAGVTLPRGIADHRSFEMSFSGLKSAVARHVASLPSPPQDQALADLCAAFQATIVETLVSKTVRAAAREEVPRIVLAGGVAANKGLRARMAEVCTRRELALFVPPFSSCTDNAAMIAYAGALRLSRGETDTLSEGPATKTALLRVTRKGGGKR
ncbi:MAG: tRNA (adenosine(37)-N6)-threonylcarbamoyltransferase complex transferase subunit TsaD [Polyangiaceae bacterium]|nr:tRNA (adenosine(37)-N6)-threonylcarbamoyltransferase complex transferase subunit TsaD [Polyangiaceae bacterium]